VIPFGAFRALLDRELEPGGPSVFEWMVERYDAIEAAESDPERHAKLVSEFLARLRGWIGTVELPPQFLVDLRTMLSQTFGPDGTYGVFIRSDTNVEDLPGFTGAGLNLTVFNVKGFDDIVASLRDVWASPFTERAFGWRQQNMEKPEYVFPAVVVQRATPSEKSGVMVTSDVESGDMRFATVAVNEGVGGAVEGQASESLLIELASGNVQFLAQATAPTRTALLNAGGVGQVAATGTDAVLREAEIRQLVELAKSLPAKFPSIQTEDGVPAPADVEFAFLKGKLVLLQIRPFVESKRARTGTYLQQLDAGLRERGDQPVDLRGIPSTPPSEGAN
jgi:phosphoenolpyruvate synthase/pyruvate phosphate dikinase